MKRLLLWLPVTVMILATSGCAAPRMLPTSMSDDVITQRAGQQRPPVWTIPLGPALVEDMWLLEPKRLLVGLKKDFPSLPNMGYLLIDTGTGGVLWRHERNENDEWYLVLASADRLLFSVTSGKNVSLTAINAGTGKTDWSSDLGSGRIAIMPDSAGLRSVAVREEEKETVLTALSMTNGDTIWRKVYSSGARRPSPLIGVKTLWHFYSGVECFSLEDGKALWARPDIHVSEGAAQPQLEGDTLLIINNDNTLSALDAGTGVTLWFVRLPEARYTNIYPYGEKVYVRGITKMTGGRYKLYAIGGIKRKVLWTYSGMEPSISNLIESNGRLYLGTATSLVAVDTGNGQEIFSDQVSATGRAYPIHIRKIDNKVVFIGELTVAAYDAATGRQIYWQGMTPISNEAYLSGLDASISHMKEAEAGISPTGYFGVVSNMAAKESERYQNMANSYHKLAVDYYRKGEYFQGASANITANSSRMEARNQANISFAASIANLAELWVAYSQQLAIETSIKRQELFRSSILWAYGMGETAEYVFRPNLQRRNAEDVFVTLSVIRLSDGRRKDTVLSPQYLGYGLWNLLDLEKGVVYHNGIGMDPARYHYSAARTLYPYGKVQTLENYLIAAPVTIPR